MKNILNLPTLVILCIALTFTACDKDIAPVVNEYPSLRVVNHLSTLSGTITRVSLAGYEFDEFNILPQGNARTFVLDKGMPDGYEDINITVGCRCGPSSPSIIVDFKDGETISIRLKEGPDGTIYLE